MIKLNSVSANKTIIPFVRVLLLLMLIAYIVFRILYFLGFFMEDINCSAEKVVVKENKECLISDNGYRFDNSIGRTDEKAFEGKYSVKLIPESQYGMPITFDVPKGGEEFEASVWCFEQVTSADSAGWPYLVASVGLQFWKGANDVSDRKDGWTKLHFKFTIPPANYTAPVVFYCWNNTKNAVFFDNLTIRRKNIWKFFKQGN